MTTVVRERIIEKEEHLSQPEQEEWRGQEVEPEEIEYPDTDGEPMGETGFHVKATMRLYEALDQFFLNRDDVYVAADMFLYYEEGNPRANKAPDVMVIKGVDKHERRTFKIWEEQAGPCVIIEVTSKSTMIDDMVNKSILYSALGVQEYFLFDPLYEYLDQGLLGFRLDQHEYVPIEPVQNGCLVSEALGVLLCPDHAILRVIDPQIGQAVPSLDEAVALAAREAQRAEQEAQRAERLAAKLRELGIEPEA